MIDWPWCHDDWHFGVVAALELDLRALKSHHGSRRGRRCTTLTIVLRRLLDRVTTDEHELHPNQRVARLAPHARGERRGARHHGVALPLVLGGIQGATRRLDRRKRQPAPASTEVVGGTSARTLTEMATKRRFPTPPDVATYPDTKRESTVTEDAKARAEEHLLVDGLFRALGDDRRRVRRLVNTILLRLDSRR